MNGTTNEKYGNVPHWIVFPLFVWIGYLFGMDTVIQRMWKDREKIYESFKH